MTGEKKKEYTMRISIANRTQLIVILYEMFLDYITEAEDAYQNSNKVMFRDAVRKAKGCSNELLHSLDFEYEIANNLGQLYLYVNRKLTHADIRFYKEPLKEVRQIISELLEAYQEISNKDTSPAIMGNAQTVYAGLTYGKKNLVENLSNQGVDRGFLA